MDKKLVYLLALFFTVNFAKAQDYNYLTDLKESLSELVKKPPHVRDSLIRRIARNPEKVDTVYLGWAYRTLFMIESEKGHSQDALENILKAYAVDKKAGIKKAMISDLSNIVTYYVEQDKTGDARPFVEELTEILPVAPPSYRGFLSLNIGAYYKMIGMTDSAIKYSERVLIDTNIREWKKYWSRALLNLYGLMREKGVSSDSLQYYVERALELSDTTDTREELTKVLHYAGLAYYNQGKYAKSLLFLDSAHRYAKHEKLNQQLAQIYYHRAKTLEKQGKLNKAYQSLQKYDSVTRLFRDSSSAEALSEMTKRFETDFVKQQKEKISLRLAKERQENLFLIIGLSLTGALLLTGVVLYRQRRKLSAQKVQILEDQIKSQKREEQLRVYESEMRGQTKERKRIGQELHDSLGSLLSAGKLRLQNIGNDGELKDLLEESSREVKRISKDLISPLEDAHLGTAIRGIVNRFRNSSIKSHINFYGLDQRMPREVEENILSVITELITNTHEHSGAKNYHLTITRHQDHLNLIYEDDGKGLGIDNLEESQGSGLLNIKNRVEKLNGNVYLEDKTRSGFTLVINIPLDGFSAEK